MIKRDELINFIKKSIGKDFLEKALKVDDFANGVQILGGDKVNKISLGVSVNRQFLESAVRKGSNFCIFHHGLDVSTYKSLYPRFLQKRLKFIFENEITVVAFHYGLDAHPVIGNNVTIIKKLGAKVDKQLMDDWGFTAVFPKPQSVDVLRRKCREIFDHGVLAVTPGPSKVKIIGVVSGGAKPKAADLAEFEEKGVELFISGETSEPVPHKMKESGINYFACGHYATEKFGVQNLGKMIMSHFKSKIEVEFIDVKNPV